MIDSTQTDPEVNPNNQEQVGQTMKAPQKLQVHEAHPAKVEAKVRMVAPMNGEDQQEYQNQEYQRAHLAKVT